MFVTVYFTVSSRQRDDRNVSIPSTSLECSPSGNLSSDIEIASIPIGPDGSFTFEESHSGPGDSETITYTFNGHVHGPSTAGNTRIDGIWRENITYANNGPRRRGRKEEGGGGGGEGGAGGGSGRRMFALLFAPRLKTAKSYAPRKHKSQFFRASANENKSCSERARLSTRSVTHR